MEGRSTGPGDGENNNNNNSFNVEEGLFKVSCDAPVSEAEPVTLQVAPNGPNGEAEVVALLTHELLSAVWLRDAPGDRAPDVAACAAGQMHGFNAKRDLFTRLLGLSGNIQGSLDRLRDQDPERIQHVLSLLEAQPTYADLAALLTVWASQCQKLPKKDAKKPPQWSTQIRRTGYWDIFREAWPRQAVVVTDEIAGWPVVHRPQSAYAGSS